MRNILILVLLSSCLGKGNSFSKGIDVVAINESLIGIDSIRVSTSEGLDTVELASLERGRNQKVFLGMENNQTDGSYKIDWLYNGEWRTINCGYYTNGYPLNEKVIIRIKLDSIASNFDIAGNASSVVRYKIGLEKLN